MGDCTEDAQEGRHEKMADEDLSVAAKDIAKRFEQLESQWLHFQRKSEKWDGEVRLAAEPTVPNDCEVDCEVPTAAFSYSNPLFSNHKPVKRRPAENSPRSMNSARSHVPSLTSYNSERGLSARHRKRLWNLLGSERQFTDDTVRMHPGTNHTGNSSSPKHPVLSRINNVDTENGLAASTLGRGLPMRSDCTPDKMMNNPVSSGCEAISKLCSPSSNTDVMRHLKAAGPSGSAVDDRNHILSTSKVQYRSKAALKCTGSAWSAKSFRPFATSNLSTLDPATYSSGKGPPGLQMPPEIEKLGSTEVAHSSRSPPPVTPSASSARDTDPHSDASTMDPTSRLRLRHHRNGPQKMLTDCHIISEGASTSNRFHSQIPQDNVERTERSIGLANPNFSSLLSEKSTKSEVQMDWKDRKGISVLVQHKLDHTLSKVEWELRLSKRESKLKMAEEMLLDEQQKLSEARLALSKCEDALSQREEVVSHIEQKRDLEVILESVQKGTVVMGKLIAALRDILAEMERKELVLHDLWSEYTQSRDDEWGQQFIFGMEQEQQQRGPSFAIDLNGISLLSTSNDGKDWCAIVINVCERLGRFLSQETNLQKWAVLLERESMRMKSLEDEITKAKDVTNEQFKKAADMMRGAEEQSRMAEEERRTLSTERDSVSQWVTQLQERRKAVSECEREAATSLAEIQKKTATLFAHESSIDGKALEISALQEELWATSMRLHDDQELVNKERLKVQERLRQISARERDAESQLQGTRRLKEDLETQMQQFESTRLAEEKKRERTQNLHRDIEARLDAREMTLRDIESQLGEKAIAAESLAAQLTEREKILKSMHEHCEIERLQTKEAMAELEREKESIKDSASIFVEADVSKKNADEAWARVAKERREADEYFKSVEERIRAWEDKLRQKEKELQQQQLAMRDIEMRLQDEHDNIQALYDKWINEKESWEEELATKEDSLASKTKAHESKENEIKGDLEKLTEERKLAASEIKRFAEMEARAWAAERELQSKHDDHIQEVRQHENTYRAQIEELQLARREVEREFEEVHSKRDELLAWQREAEKTVQSRIQSFSKGKDELQMQIQELKKLQLDIEQAGAKIIDTVAELDQASSKLEMQRSKVEISKGKLESLARNLGQQQELVKGRENTLVAQEEKIASALVDVKRITTEAAVKEKNLKFKEQAVAESQRELQELEERLATERVGLDKMIAEMERHAAALKGESASSEENSRQRSREQALLEEKRQDILSKEKELSSYEATLKSRAVSLEEHGKALAKLEQQVQERLCASLDIDKGWEKLREEQIAYGAQKDALNKQKEDLQSSKADQDFWAREDAHRKASARDDLDRQKMEMLLAVREREHAVHARECRLAERESLLQTLERQGKTHIDKNTEELRSQVNSAREELDAQKQYVEERRKASEAIAATIEEREAKLRAKEKEIEKREAFLRELERRSLTIPEVYEKEEENRAGTDSESSLPMFNEAPLYSIAFGASDKRQDTSSQEETCLRKERRNASIKNEGMTKLRVKHMKDGLHKEATKVTQERSSLQAQQRELEETRKAVQDVKQTLTAQLKATKQMVAEAALTAQNATREREAMEEERRRLEKAQREAEANIAAKEAKLLGETKQLEDMRASLFQEKAQAMDVLQRAAMAIEQERFKALENGILEKERQSEAQIQERERVLNKKAEIIKRDKAGLESEKVKLNCFYKALEKTKHGQPSTTAACHDFGMDGQKEGIEQMVWDGSYNLQERRRSDVVQNSEHVPEIHTGTYSSRGTTASRDYTIPLHSRSQSGVIGNSGFNFIRARGKSIEQNGLKSSWDEMLNSSLSFISPETSVSLRPAAHQSSPEKELGDHNRHLNSGEEISPSQKRLDNVMSSLINARQASRSRLQRTENALLGFPPSSPVTNQVQQALNALSARLSLMEQIEDGLASHLKKAYESDHPESEGLIVDKAQLLCRMEEQQSLRAEWEEDMQQQLETISMLQASSRNSLAFHSPSVTGMKSASNLQDTALLPEWRRYSFDAEDEKCGRSHGDLLDTTRTPITTTTSSGSSESNPPQQYQSPPEWKPTFEPLLGVDAPGLSLSPLVDYPTDLAHIQGSRRDFGGKERSGGDRTARRKLHLSSSQEYRYPVDGSC